MLAVGIFALGIFIGTIVTTAVEKINDWSNAQKLLSAIFSAVFAGVILAFIRIAGGEHVQETAAYYPIGLFYGMLWWYTRAAVEHIQSTNKGLVFLGWLHICGLALSVPLAGIFLWPVLRELTH